MHSSPNQPAKLTIWRNRIAVGVLLAVALEIPTSRWLVVWGWQHFACVSNASAAEGLPADKPVAGSDDKLLDEPGIEQPAGAPKNEAPAIEYFPRPTKQEIKIIEALAKPTSIE